MAKKFFWLRNYVTSKEKETEDYWCFYCTCALINHFIHPSRSDEEVVYSEYLEIEKNTSKGHPVYCSSRYYI